MPLTLLPDVEAALIAWLRAHADVAALTTNVGWEIKSPYPCLRLVQVGETADSIMRVGEALIQFDAYGAPDVVSASNRVALSLLLRTTMAEVRKQFPGRVTASAVYTRVRTINGLQWAPDEPARQQRYFGRLIVAAHAV